MGVLGPMARNIPDLALLLSVQAGFDPRVPLSIDEPGSVFTASLERDFKGARIAWAGDFAGFAPCDPGVLDLCAAALRSFEALGCIVEPALPDYPLEPVWRAVMQLRHWQVGSGLLAYYNDPAKRAQLKPEAIFEIENGLRLSAYDISAASVIRTQWHQAMLRFFEEYDFLIAPAAQIFPFEIDLRWPREIAGQAMQTYHEWMKGVLLVTLSGCPALAAPAGFGPHGLPIGIQIIAANRRERDCLQLAHAYAQATNWTQHLPPLISGK
jgi:amidase